MAVSSYLTFLKLAETRLSWRGAEQMAAIADMSYLNASASYGQPEAYQHGMSNSLHSTAALTTQSLAPTSHPVSNMSHPASPPDIVILLIRPL